MQVHCPKCQVIVAIGRDKWFFDGGECRELRGTVAGDAKEYEKCPVLIEAVSTVRKNAAS
ncbi:hypothetical protein ABIC02_000023 [Bradyrhizobium sp. RT5a]